MNKLLVLFYFVGLVYCVEAATKGEIFSLIHDTLHEVRQEHTSQIKSTTKEALEWAISPEQTACVNRHLSNTYKDLNDGISSAMNGMKYEYGTKKTAELEGVTVEQEKQKILSKIMSSLNGFQERIKEIKECTKKYKLLENASSVS